ncbi:Mur ligase family protein [Campylobacter helveticus]|uniref:Mur ligase family protein n=1 Tax=Campylobacter helveticus TaxID=28898 RepID=UPI00214A70EB|nr:UDP-N-acetylmuramoyl-tripeptide--D-alanyl-D-alanine ligase [Campylobacter helveticus]MCR2065291.1 UDP-N-acetylmuramoyl-tripeptide--D-alanyl-D-alanine ligase [Campylobacter helveticus]
MLHSIYFINTLLFNFCVAFYLILALQWYSYKLKRIIFHYHKPLWHLYFLALPYLIFITSLGFSWLSLAYFVLIHTPILYFWHKRIDKKLVFTAKVGWFFLFVFGFNVLFAILSLRFSFLYNLLSLPCALISLKILDLLQARYFLKKAKHKILKNNHLTIILITASFGKTSIKNFLYELLKDDFITSKSPRSVNTLMGIVKDINENLKDDTQIYIAEAGARLRGDILELSDFLEPQICIIGEIGGAHLEYFKNIENTRETKLEALQSKRLKQAFLHSSTLKKDEENIKIYDILLLNSHSNLEGLEFSMRLNEKEEHFKSSILGAFNAENLCACVCCANFLGIKLEKIKEQIANLKAVEHRLQIISKEPKFIIDDGFNGNFKGMSESYQLAKTYKGRRILVTPGIIEGGEEDNIKLAKIINESFDLAIISAHINATLFEKELKINKIILKEKAELVQILAKHTKNGDLILFSNDAPSYL